MAQIADDGDAEQAAVALQRVHEPSLVLAVLVLALNLPNQSLRFAHELEHAVSILANPFHERHELALLLLRSLPLARLGDVAHDQQHAAELVSFTDDGPPHELERPLAAHELLRHLFHAQLER